MFVSVRERRGEADCKCAVEKLSEGEGGKDIERRERKRERERSREVVIGTETERNKVMRSMNLCFEKQRGIIQVISCIPRLVQVLFLFTSGYFNNCSASSST